MAEELREKLGRVDVSAPSIQSAANAMMKHYDKSTTLIAVTEWRNILSTTRNPDHFLPLLYVANEVLQNSKRNRGNKFLESFSPILKQSLVFMAQQSQPAVVEKIRRTVKIWGDRRVFSGRYVQELLQALEAYRHEAPEAPPQLPVEEEDVPHEEEEAATFSPPAQDGVDELAPDAHDDILDILQAHEREKFQPSHLMEDDDAVIDVDDDDDDDDRDDLFAESNSSGPMLAIDVADVVAKASRHQQRNTTAKRRRSSGSTGAAAERRSSSSKSHVLSNSHFLEVWNQLVENQQRFDIAQHTLRRIQENVEQTSNEELCNLIGDALQQAVKQNDADMKTMVQQKRILHTLANERYMLGLEVIRYIPWLEASIQQDSDDIAFCTALEEKIRQMLPIHVELQKARAILQKEQQRRAEIQAEQERRRQEAEEEAKFRDAALAKQTEAKPGMVWNPSTREYQALNTDESWRD
jgi:CID domain